MPSLTPYLTIGGGRAAEAVDFYVNALGGQEVARMPAQDGKRLMHAHLKLGGQDLFLSDDFRDVPGPAPAGVTLHLQLDEVDPVWERAVGAGCEVTMPLENQFWGDRYGKLKDPFGHNWSLASPAKR